jgi:L-ascorbate oxidase
LLPIHRPPRYCAPIGVFEHRVRIDRVLALGSADEWQLQSRFVSHPFHIHVNPFQIVKILDPHGKDVSAPNAVDDADGQNPDPQYPGLKGVWKDTLWVKSLLPAKPPNSSGLYTIVARIRYQRYIGEFVLHCHILDHEDQGMMQNVRIAVPDGGGSVGASGHH